MTSPITTHVLDTACGAPAAGVRVTLDLESAPGTWTRAGGGTTDGAGRTQALLHEGTLTAGPYRLVFEVGAYFESRGVEAFWPQVTVAFLVRDVHAHYHVPLLVSPFGYSTYRGS